jgi:hypothetical protein
MTHAAEPAVDKSCQEVSKQQAKYTIQEEKKGKLNHY